MKRKSAEKQREEDELVVRKMMQISKEVEEGKRKTYTHEQMKKKYGWK